MIIAETDSAAHDIADRIRGAQGSAPGAHPGGRAPAGAGGGDPTAGPAGVQLMGGVDSVLEKAKALHDAGVGILDVALVGGMKRSMELFGRAFAEPLREVA